MNRRPSNKQESSSEGGDFDEEEDSDESEEEEEEFEEESSVEEEEEEETGLASILGASLDHLKGEYDRLVQQKLQELEQKKNVEISFFREQQQLFKAELLALRKEKQDSAQIIRELQGQLAAQCVEFNETLAAWKNSVN